MAIDVSKYTNEVRTAVMAKDVRGSIADSIDNVASEVNNYEATLSADNDQFKDDIGTRQTNIETRETNLENTFNAQIKNAVSSNPSSAETVAARQGYDTLLKNLEAKDNKIGILNNLTTTAKDSTVNAINEVNSQLADKVNLVDLNTTNQNVATNTSNITTLQSIKADTTYVDTKTQGISLAYKESYATLSALQTAYPSGDTYNHVVLTDGMIYTYKNGWISTQIQANGTGLAPSSIALENIGYNLTNTVKSLYIDSSNKDYLSLASDASSFTAYSGANTTYILDKIIPKNVYIKTINFYVTQSTSIKIKFFTKSNLNFSLVKEIDVSAISGLNTINVNWITTDDVYIGYYSSTISVNYKSRTPSNSTGYFYQYNGDIVGTSACTYNQVSLDFAIGVIGMNVSSIVDNMKNMLLDVASLNLFNLSTVTTGKYILYTDGSIQINANYCYSDYINVQSNTIYSLVLPTSNDIQIAFYDSNKTYISGLDFVSSSNSSFPTPNNAVYLIVSLQTSTIGTFMLVLGNELPNSYVNYGQPIVLLKQNIIDENNLTETLKAKLHINENSKVITVAKSGGDYTTINDAINNANDSTDNPVTFLLYPGTYKEVVNIGGKRNISIIGINRETCIIRDDSGHYQNSPLRICGNCYIANLTVISTHQDAGNWLPDANSSNVSNWPSYALHCDDINNGSGIAHIHNCYLYSENAPSVGCGGQDNQIIKLTNCEIENNIPDSFYNASSKCHNGALFLHPSWTTSFLNQRFILKDCIVKSNRDEVFVTETATATNNINLSMSFYNNILYSTTKGKDVSIFKNNTPESQITGDSFGNNVVTINA